MGTSLSSWRLAALVFLTLPLAAAGAVLAAFLVGGIMTLGALLGLFTVLALTVRNSLGIVSGYTLGNFIYVLLVIAIVLFLVRLIGGRTAV